jgi:hypothetical protein
VTEPLKSAAKAAHESEWRKIRDTNQECAEIVFVPNSLENKKTGPEYCFIATREELTDIPVELRQRLLFDDDDAGDIPSFRSSPNFNEGQVI